MWITWSQCSFERDVTWFQVSFGRGGTWFQDRIGVVSHWFISWTRSYLIPRWFRNRVILVSDELVVVLLGSKLVWA